jgi:hypothetical protein
MAPNNRICCRSKLIGYIRVWVEKGSEQHDRVRGNRKRCELTHAW